MYEIIFYEDKNGNSEVINYINKLKEERNSNKNSRIKLNKIVAYLNILEDMGTRIGDPVTKHLEGEIWELRPLKNRILYAYFKENRFVILHHFVKKTKKTPKKEIERAKKNLYDFLEREGRDGN